MFMKTKKWISWLFVLSAIYDGILGLLFLAAPGLAFERFGVTPPNHFGYVQFPAALLLVFAWMFAAVAMAPERNRNLIPYGMGLKAAYCLVVFYYWLTIQIPPMWKPFAIADLGFLALFFLAYVQLGKR
jgi:hypothetical protein